jgi:hypothetical protein
MREAKNNELKEEVVKNFKENLSQEINNHPLSSILCEERYMLLFPLIKLYLDYHQRLSFQKKFYHIRESLMIL